MEGKIELIRELLQKGNPVTMSVSSYSMWPALAPGDFIVVGNGKIRKGDILVFKRKDFFVVHRLILQIFGLYLLKGDSSRYLDILIGKGKILGKVLVVKKKS